MGVSARLAYGLILTDDFGGQLDEIPDELFEFGRGTPDEDEYYEVDREFIVDQTTCESPALVLGVKVPTGPQGWTWMPGEEPLGEVHEKYLAVLAKCHAQIQALVASLDQTPRLHVLAGEI